MSRSSLFRKEALSEHCTFCDADVHLESPEVAYCCGIQSEKGFSKHKLQRCAVSLQVSEFLSIRLRTFQHKYFLAAVNAHLFFSCFFVIFIFIFIFTLSPSHGGLVYMQLDRSFSSKICES